MTHLVEAVYLNQRMSSNHHPVAVVDCRFSLNDPGAGRSAYEQGHVPGAVFADLDLDLSGPVSEHGGRHPLPDIGQLTVTLGKLGIDRQTEVVAYDDQGGLFAARLWWLLKWLGHDRVAVLNGGYSAWLKAGFGVTADTPRPIPCQYTPALQPDWEAVTAEQVRAKLGEPGLQLIDSRERQRYLGFEEPIDKVAGHIPGALYYFWKDVLGPDGLWKSPEELRQHFEALDADREVIVYCGSGVSACPNVLALHLAGFGKVKLYAGSWSDWISYPEHPIAQGEA